jgi:hypothetical protein
LDSLSSRGCKGQVQTKQEDEEPTFLLPCLHFFFAGAKEGDDSTAILFHASTGSSQPQDTIETIAGGRAVNELRSIELEISTKLRDLIGVGSTKISNRLELGLPRLVKRDAGDASMVRKRTSPVAVVAAEHSVLVRLQGTVRWRTFSSAQMREKKEQQSLRG